MEQRTDIDVILFDFGGTLAEEVDSLFLAEDDVPSTWRDIWNAQFAEPGFPGRWERGDVRAPQLIADLAQRFGTEPNVVSRHIQNRCHSVAFYPGIMNVVTARRRRAKPQALVTINPDLFLQIAQHYSLDELFDTIVLSALEGTVDKVELCRIALDRLGRNVSSAFLIDNRPEHIQAFEAAGGGGGYQFVDDATFLADLVSGHLPPSLAS